jgi:4-amino-4-deoxy-L-arabinose transferase-like glycosyltransferase
MLFNTRYNKLVVNWIQSYGIWILILIGFALRLRQYLIFRSFWLDESFVILNLRDRTYAGLTEPLDYSQIAPIGFLFTEKMIFDLFGASEWSLRLVPLVASLFSIWLVYKISDRLFGKVGAFITLLFFILPTGLTYFASEVKQYSTDVFFCLVTIWSFLRYFDEKNTKNAITLMITGSIAILFSNVAIIYLTSSSLVLGIYNIKLRRFSWLESVMIIAWVSIFALYYFGFLSDNPNRPGMEAYWSKHFMPLSLEGFRWLYITLRDNFSYSFAFNFERSHTWLIILLMIVGFINLYRSKKWPALLILLPIIIHLVLSTLKLYPFGDRLILYLVPLFILLLSAGIYYLPKLNKYVLYLSLVLIIYLSYKPAVGAINYFIKPFYREHITGGLKYIEKRMLPDDRVYIYAASKTAYYLYEDKYFKGHSVTIGEKSGDNWEKFTNQYQKLNGRYWIIFSHGYPLEGVEYIIHDMSKYEVLDHYDEKGSRVWLVDFKNHSSE